MLSTRNRSEVEARKRSRLPAKGDLDAFNLMENITQTKTEVAEPGAATEPNEHDELAAFEQLRGASALGEEVAA